MTHDMAENLLAASDPVLSPEEELRLFTALRQAKSKKKIQRLREEIARANYPLVVKVYHYIRGPALDKEDFLSEGVAVLMHAIDIFNVDSGNKFSTYLYRALFNRYCRINQCEYRHKSNHKPIYHNDERLVDDDDDLDEGLCIIDDLDEENQTVEGVRLAIEAALQPDEAAVFRLKYGIASLTQIPLCEISKKLGFSMNKTKSLHRSAIAKMRIELAARKLI